MGSIQLVAEVPGPRSRELEARRAGTYNNVLRFLAPLVISDEELDEGLDVLEGALREVSNGA